MANSKRVYLQIVVFIGWFGLALQLYMMLIGPSEKKILERIINYFSYFTILTNILLAFGSTMALYKPNTELGKFFSKSGTESALTVYIVIVGIIHFLFLRNIVDLHGWNLLADTILHKIIPALYLIYWILFVPKGQLNWRESFQWLVYPFIYFIYVLIRGFIDCFYPYYFADVNKLGYGKALVNGIWIMISFSVFGLLLVAIDNAIKKSRASRP